MPETLQPVLDAALDAAIGMRSDGVVVGWNRAAEATFGWRKDEAIGRLLAELIIPQELREVHAQGLQRYKATGRDVILGRRIEITALHRLGHVFQVELAITLTQARDHGQEVFLGFLRDISERKRAEAALRQRTAPPRLCSTQGNLKT